MPIRRSYTEIKSDAKNRLRTNTPVNNFTHTSIANAFLDVIAAESQALYDAIDYIHKSLDPTLNFGKELDNIGYLVGVDRAEASIAIDDSDTNFYFYIDKSINATPAQLLNQVYPINTHFNIRERLVAEGYIDDATSPTKIILPKDLLISNTDGSKSYKTLRKTEITANKPNAFTGIIANIEGSISNIESNVLVKHNLSTFNTFQYLAKYILCTNNFPINTGIDGLNDRDYRYNLTLKTQNYVNNEVAIRQMALAVPGVRDILFERSKYGYGTYGIIVEGTSPLISDGIIDSVQQRLQAISGGDVVFVTKPEYKGVEISFQLTIDIGGDSTAAINTVRTQIINYIINRPIGGTIIWNEIISLIMSVPDVKDFFTDYYMIGDYDAYAKLNKNRIALRTINQRSYETEKFYTDKGLIKVCSKQV